MDFGGNLWSCWVWYKELLIKGLFAQHSFKMKTFKIWCFSVSHLHENAVKTILVECFWNALASVSPPTGGLKHLRVKNVTLRQKKPHCFHRKRWPKFWWWSGSRSCHERVVRQTGWTWTPNSAFIAARKQRTWPLRQTGNRGGKLTTTRRGTEENWGLKNGGRMVKNRTQVNRIGLIKQGERHYLVTWI